MLPSTRHHLLYYYHRISNWYAYHHHKSIDMMRILTHNIARIRIFRFLVQIYSFYRKQRRIDSHWLSKQSYSLRYQYNEILPNDHRSIDMYHWRDRRKINLYHMQRKEI